MDPQVLKLALQVTGCAVMTGTAIYAYLVAKNAVNGGEKLPPLTGECAEEVGNYATTFASAATATEALANHKKYSGLTATIKNRANDFFNPHEFAHALKEGETQATKICDQACKHRNVFTPGSCGVKTNRQTIHRAR